MARNEDQYGYGNRRDGYDAYGSYEAGNGQPAPNRRQAQPYRQPPQNAAAQSGYRPATGVHSRGGGGQRQQPQGAYNQYARSAASYHASGAAQGMSTGKKVAIVVAVLVLIAAIAAAGFFVYKEMRKASVNADLHNMDKETLNAIDEQLTGSTDFQEPFTVLLLGSDERGEEWGGDGSARTDTIILVRVDAVNKSVNMVSIPRDTMVQLPGVGTAKINAAYFYDGAPGTIAAVKDLTGVDIDHYVFIDFDGLMDLVNAIGGIDVYVDERIDNPRAGHAVVEEGQQHLDGEQALVLARNRDYVDGDYTRVTNQRKVIMGIVERLMNAYASELAGLIQASTKCVQTDSGIDFDWLYSLADQIRHTDIEHPLEVKSTTLPSQPAYIGDVSYVVADRAGTAELMQIFTSGGDVSQPLTQSSIGTDVANAGGGSGPTIGAGDEFYYYEDTGETYEEEAPAAEAAPADEGGAAEAEEDFS